MLNVLLLRPDPVLLHATKHVVEKIGHRTKTCSTPRQAFNALDSARFDLVFLDYTQAEMNVFEAIRVFQKHENCPRHIVLASMNNDPSLLHRAKEVGVTKVVPKRLDVNEIKELFSKLESYPPNVAAKGQSPYASELN